MENVNFSLEREKCTHCDACINDCPRHLIRVTDGFPALPAEHESRCIACQHCLAVCPTGAVSVLGLNPENSIPLDNAPTVSPEAMSTFVRGRRTVRQYRAENVDRQLIDRLLADTAHAPTGGNTCDLTFIVVTDRSKMALLLERLMTGLEQAAATGRALPKFVHEAIRDYRRDGTDEIFRGAPHLVFASAGDKAYCGDADVVIALSYFELLAQSQGLGTTWCDFLKFILDPLPELCDIFGISPKRPYRAMLFGIPAVHYARTVQRDDVAKIKAL